LDWKEVNTKLDPFDFNIETIIGRVEKKGDLWGATASGEIEKT